jgi:hypothetical protein
MVNVIGSRVLSLGVSAGFWSSAGAGVEVEVPDELSDTGGAHADKATTIMATAIRSARNFVFFIIGSPFFDFWIFNELIFSLHLL